MLSTILLLTLAVRVGALDAVAIQSFDRSHPFLSGYRPVDLKPRPERILQTEECPVCARLGTRFLPLVIPDLNINDFTCQDANEGYKEVITSNRLELLSHDVIAPCAAYQDTYEELCCEVSGVVPHYQCEKNVKTYLFEPPSSYDTSIIPRAIGPAHLYVDTLLTYWAIGEISLAQSTVELVVEITLSWNDPQLAWDLTSDNCATSTLMRASLDKQLTDIWVPEFDLINREIGVQSFAETPATVYSDGTVVWNRSGQIKAFCSFVGLRRLPYDELGCQFLFGDLTNAKIYYNAVDLGNNHKGVRFADHSQTYSEYSVVHEKTTSTISSRGVEIDFYFKRGLRHYLYLIILPTILFVFLSFGHFFFDPASGERISFVLNVLLVVVAQNIITSELLPLCQESLWLNEFTTYSMFFVLAGVFEALLFYIALGKQPKKIEKDLSVDHSARPARNNAESPDHYSVTSVEAKSDYDSSSSVDAPKSKIGIQPAFFGQRGKELRIKVLKIMIWVDFLAKFVLPISYILFLIIMFATNKNLDDDANEIS